MHTRFRTACLLVFMAFVSTGCQSVTGGRAGASPKVRTITSIGDSPQSVVAGVPGESVTTNPGGPTPRSDTDGRISGRVVDLKGRAVPNAQVRIAVGGSSAGRAIRTTTDGAGRFTLRGLRADSTYTLIAEDEQGDLLGRASAVTADTQVRITLRSAGDPGPSPRRVQKASDRGGISEDEDPREVPLRVNDEDLPPPPTEASEIVPRTSNRSGSDLEDDALTRRTATWRRGGTSLPASQRDIDEAVPLPASSGALGGGSASSGRFETGEDEGPDPLPPARANGQVGSRRRTGRVDNPANEGVNDAGVSRSAPGAPGAIVPAPARQEPPATRPDSNDGEVPEARRVAPSPSPADGPAGVTEPMVAKNEQPQSADGPVPMAPSSSPSPSAGSPETKTAETPAPSGATEPAAPPVVLTASAPIVEPPTSIVEPPTSIPSAPADAAPARPETKETAANTSVTPEQTTQMQVVPVVENNGPSPGNPSPVTDTAQAQAPIAPASPESASAPESAPRKRPTWGELPSRRTPQLAIANPAAAARRPADSEGESQAGARSSTSVNRSNDGRVVRAACRFDPKTQRLVDFILPDLYGNPVQLSKLDGDVILLDFWGTWCKPCRDTIPHLVELQNRYGSRLRIIGIAYENEDVVERAAVVEKAAQALGINYTLLLGSADGSPCPLQSALRIQAYPTMILLSRNGRILWRDSGSDPRVIDRLDRAIAVQTGDSSVVRR
jgi:thiol-disulfide isomerase/thioredoxin